MASQLVGPVLMKEQLVSQLKTQVTDLERFIEFLQKGNYFCLFVCFYSFLMIFKF